MREQSIWLSVVCRKQKNKVVIFGGNLSGESKYFVNATKLHNVLADEVEWIFNPTLLQARPEKKYRHVLLCGPATLSRGLISHGWILR